MGISQRAELDAKPMESNPTPCGEILGRVEGRVNKPGQLSPGACCRCQDYGFQLSSPASVDFVSESL